MTEQTEATVSDPESIDSTPRTFLEQLQAIAGPRNWLLHATNQQEPDATQPHAIAPLPLPKSFDLETWLACNGAREGRYLVKLEAVGMSSNQARQRLDRLQKSGPVQAIVTVRREHVAVAEQSEPTATTRPRPARPAPSESPGVKMKADELAMMKLENERLALEAEQRKLRKQIRELDSPTPADGATASPLSGIMAVVGPLVPFAVEFVRGFLETQKQTAQAIQQLLLARASEPSTSPAGGASLESLLALVPKVKELTKLFGGLAPRDDDEPQSEFGAMLSTVRDMLPMLAGNASGAAAPATNGAAPRRAMTAHDMMNLRVLKFFEAIRREQELTADPASTADAMMAQIGQLPEAFRALLASSKNVDALLAGLPRWLPPGLKDTVPNAIRIDQKRRAWLQSFLDAVHENIADAAAADGDDGGDDGGGDELGAELHDVDNGNA